MLELWEREGTFERLREQNRGGPRFSFVDGPVTANKKLALHTAWGRTLKDVFQRYKALRGFDQRYQNGFDCQGLWIEVGVERSLGLNSKREIEEFGLGGVRAPLPRGRRLVVAGADARLDPPRSVDGLGQRLLHVQRHQHRVRLAAAQAGARAGLALHGPPLDRVVPRCGTSLSQHELSQAGVYQDRADPSLFVRLPLLDRERESLVVWTTTPWTLPANVAAAVKPDAEYGRRENGEWVAVGRYPEERLRGAQTGRRARRLALPRPLRRAGAGSRRRAPRDPVGGRHPRPGHGDRPHRAGLRRRGLRALEGARAGGPDAGRRGGPLLRRLRLVARPLDHRVERPDHRQPRRARPARRGRALRARLPALLALRHAADLPPLRRLVHLGRGAAPEAPRGQPGGRVDAGLHGQAHGRLAPQHGRLEHLEAALLRPAAALLPLRLRPPERDRVEGRAGGAGRAGTRAARGAAPALDRRGADRVRGVRRGGAPRRRGGRRLARRGHRPLLDARVGEPGVGAGGVRDRSGQGPDDGRPPRPRLLGGVVPGRLGLGDARADPALVLLAALHVGRPHRARPVPARARLREDARRDRPGDARLLGEHDRGGGGVRADGRRRDALAVLRAAARPQPALRLRPRERDQAQAADTLELGSLPRRLRADRGLHARLGRARRRGGTSARPLARRARPSWSSRRPPATRPT